jgi:hypothetical protein
LTCGQHTAHPPLAVFRLQIGMLAGKVRDLCLDRSGERGTGPMREISVSRSSNSLG